MTPSDLIEKYTGRATYQITVEGMVNPHFVKNMVDLKVTHTKTADNSLSTLTGEMQDQEALSGLLNMLFDNRFPLISVIKVI